MEKEKYLVYVTETLQRKVLVDAESLTKAEEMVQQQYENGEVVLDYNDYLQVEFDARSL